MKHNDLLSGKGAYDKNIQFVKLSPDCDILKQAVSLTEGSKDLSIDMLIHVVPNRYEVHQQKVDLLSRIIESESPVDTRQCSDMGDVSSAQGSRAGENLSTEQRVELPTSNKQPEHHVHIVHRGVECQGFQNEDGGKPMPSGCEYLKQRLAETREAFSLKYGDKVHGAEWEQTIHQVTMAAVKFEILSTNSSSPAKLDLHSVDLSTEERRRASPGCLSCITAPGWPCSSHISNNKSVQVRMKIIYHTFCQCTSLRIAKNLGLIFQMLGVTNMKYYRK